MAGVVRRDGLREAVTALRDEWTATYTRIIEADWNEEEQPVEDYAQAVCLRTVCGNLTRILDAVPDVSPTDVPASPLLAQVLEGSERAARGVPDVPPDPPAADRSAIIAVFGNLARELGYANPSWGQLADALLSSGVLVDAADVRARALRWAASFGTFPGKSWPETLRYHAEHGARYDRDEPDYFDEQGVSEREGTS